MSHASSKVRCLLRLYVAGGKPSAQKAVAAVQRIVGEYLNDICTLEIVDVTKKPQDAERDRILAIPALMRVLPEPTRKIIGDFSDNEKVINELELFTLKEQQKP